jgi:hypothetical protein
MPDIFDQIAPPLQSPAPAVAQPVARPSGDIFDQIAPGAAPMPKGDIFDMIAPAAAPVQAPQVDLSRGIGTPVDQLPAGAQPMAQPFIEDALAKPFDPTAALGPPLPVVTPISPEQVAMTEAERRFSPLAAARNQNVRPDILKLVEKEVNIWPQDHEAQQKLGPVRLGELERRRGETIEVGIKMLPGLGGLLEAGKTNAIREAIERLKENQYRDQPKGRTGGVQLLPYPHFPSLPDFTADEQRLTDQLLVQTALLEADELATRGTTLPKDIFDALTAMYPYMLEFYFTRGMAAGASAPVKAAVARLVARYGTTTSPARVISGVGKVAELLPQAAVRAPLWTPEEATRRRMPVVEMTPEGKVIYLNPGQSAAKAWLLGSKDAFISAFSEQTGGAITGVAGKVLARLPIGKTATAIVGKLRELAKRLPGGSNQAFSDAGWSSFIGELSEEHVDDLLRAVTDIEPPQAGDESTWLERMNNAVWPGNREMLVRTITLAVPSGARVGAGMLRPPTAPKAPPAAAPGTPPAAAPIGAETPAKAPGEVAAQQTLGLSVAAESVLSALPPESVQEIAGLAVASRSQFAKTQAGKTLAEAMRSEGLNYGSQTDRAAVVEAAKRRAAGMAAQTPAAETKPATDVPRETIKAPEAAVAPPSAEAPAAAPPVEVAPQAKPGASVSTVEAKLGLAQREQGAAQGKRAEPRYVYHATHEPDLAKMENRPVKTLASVGSWFTSSPHEAQQLFGPRVLRFAEPQGKFLEFDGRDPQQVDYIRIFASNSNLADEVGLNKEAAILRKTPPDTKRLAELEKKRDAQEKTMQYLTEHERIELRRLYESDKTARSLLRNAQYMAAWRAMIEKAGYDGVVWRNSRIDNPKNPHDVWLVFNKEAMPGEPWAASALAKLPAAETPPAAAPKPEWAKRMQAENVPGLKVAPIPPERAAELEKLAAKTTAAAPTVPSILSAVKPLSNLRNYARLYARFRLGLRDAEPNLPSHIASAPDMKIAAQDLRRAIDAEIAGGKPAEPTAAVPPPTEPADTWNAGFRVLADGKLIDTGKVHALPKGYEPKDLEPGFINTRTQAFVPREVFRKPGIDTGPITPRGAPPAEVAPPAAAPPGPAVAAEAKPSPKRLTRIEKPAAAEAKEAAPPEPNEERHIAPGFVAIGPATAKRIGGTGPRAIQKQLERAVQNKPKDLGFFRKWFGSLWQAGQATRDPEIIKATDELTDSPKRMSDDIVSHQKDAANLFGTLPREYRADKGGKFFELMDRTQTPEQIDADTTIPAEVRGPLKQFKAWGEERRQELLRRNVERAAATYEANPVETLADLAAKHGLDVEARQSEGGQWRLWSKETGKTVTKAEIARQLAELDNPEADYGYKYGHILHTWFGQYNLTRTDAEGKTHFIDRAETKSEALLKLMAYNKAHPEIPIENLSAKPEFIMPMDVTRVSKGRFFALAGDLEDAANLTSEQVRDVLRGKIGTKGGRQKWMPQRLERLGKEGYNEDFQRVWDIETMQFYRWKYLTDLNHKIQPMIENLRAQGKPLWADYLEESLKYAWGSRSPASAAFDDYLARVPGLGNYVKPFALERWLGKVRGAQYILKLQTGKFYVLNSLQTVQTLWPLVGTKNFFRGIHLYYTKEGQEILRRHNVLAAGGKLAETRSFRAKNISRYTPAGASEFRNQGIAFLALYDMGRRAGVPDAEAARFARLRGQVGTQFSYVSTNVPKFARGPLLGTAFQFKQFSTKQLELVGQLFRERNYTGVGRWLAAQALIGGLKIGTSKIAWVAGMGYLTQFLYNMIKDEWGEEAADTIAFGLPALAGVDMSGSMDPLNLVQEGRNVAETIGKTVLGPTGGDIVRIATTLTEEKTAGPIQPLATGRAIAASQPTLAQFDAAYRLLTTDTTRLDARGRKVFEENWKTLVPATLGFRPTQKGRDALLFDAAIALTYKRDKVLDRAVVESMAGNPTGTQEALDRWNLYFPEAPLTEKEVLARVKNREEEQSKTQTERRVGAAPPQVKKVLGVAEEPKQNSGRTSAPHRLQRTRSP